MRLLPHKIIFDHVSNQVTVDLLSDHEVLHDATNLIMLFPDHHVTYYVASQIVLYLSFGLLIYIMAQVVRDEITDEYSFHHVSDKICPAQLTYHYSE